MKSAPRFLTVAANRPANACKPALVWRGLPARVDPATAISETEFTPTVLGTVLLSANPALSGVRSAKANILIGGIYLDVDNTFDSAAPTDQLPAFVPGSTLAGPSVPVPAAADGSVPIQTVKLHLLTDPGLNGTVTYQLQNVTNYPGIAMNWPISNPGTGKDLDLDSSAHAQSTRAIAFDPSGDTATNLYVYDYGASGQLTATIVTGKRTFTITETIPATEQYQDGYPDAGWYALADSNTARYDFVPNTGAPADGDTDATPAAGLTGSPLTPTTGIFGDGLSLYEEYRGFVVRGQHRRLNPARKDVFVDVDAELQGLDTVFFTLPLTFHYLDVGEDVRDPGDLHPLVNPNGSATGCTTVPGTSPQFALRIRARAISPTLIDNTAGGIRVPAYTTEFGLHFDVGEDLNTVYLPDQHPNGSPNETEVTDIFMQSFGKSAIFPDDNGVLHSAIVCDDPTIVGCDVYDATLNAIFPGNDRVLDTPLAPGDHYEEMLRDCDDDESFYPQDQLDDLKRSIIGHEAAHGLAVNHSDFFLQNPCGTIMYSHGNIVPFPNSYLPIDIIQLRVHEKHP